MPIVPATNGKSRSGLCAEAHVGVRWGDGFVPFRVRFGQRFRVGIVRGRTAGGDKPRPYSVRDGGAGPFPRRGGSVRVPMPVRAGSGFPRGPFRPVPCSIRATVPVRHRAWGHHGRGQAPPLHRVGAALSKTLTIAPIRIHAHRCPKRVAAALAPSPDGPPSRSPSDATSAAPSPRGNGGVKPPPCRDNANARRPRPSRQHPGWSRPGRSRLGWSHLGWSHLGRSHPGRSHPGWSHPGRSHPGRQHPGRSHPGRSHLCRSRLSWSHPTPGRGRACRAAPGAARRGSRSMP